MLNIYWFNSTRFSIGTTYKGAWDGWYGPSGREWVYDVDGVISSTTAHAIASVGLGITTEAVRMLRENAMIKCPPRNDSLPICKPLVEACLFNVYQDPCEDNNLVKQWVEYDFDRILLRYKILFYFNLKITAHNYIVLLFLRIVKGSPQSLGNCRTNWRSLTAARFSLEIYRGTVREIRVCGIILGIILEIILMF